jgi:rhodanese-related sulfurtransferase
MVGLISPGEVKAWLSDGQEIAFADVRENGQFGDGHPFFAVSLAYSVFEVRLVGTVPNPSVRLVLYDDGDGLAGLAAERAQELGYTNVFIMDGGAAAWKAAGYTLYQGVNLPSKTFGELLELEHHTPNVTAEELAILSDEIPNHIIIDSRPFAEYNRFNIPGGICCPNGEVALRIGELVPDPKTTIVVNCAGRTRSILGAETLRAFGVPNPVYALENGTQGWLLAGLQREEGATRSYPPAPTSQSTLDGIRSMAGACAKKTGLQYIDAAQAVDWLADKTRSTYLFDVRSEEEFELDGIAGSRHVLGGQLVQAADIYMGVFGGRAIVMDEEMVRAPMMANWIHQIGYEVAVLKGGVSALRAITLPAIPEFKSAPVSSVSPEDAKRQLGEGKGALLDLRSVLVYRAGHIDGAIWSMRPSLGKLSLMADTSVLLIADDAEVAALAAQRLGELGVTRVQRISGDEAAWQAAGFAIISTSDEPADSESVDLTFHIHQRLNGNDSEAGAKGYLAWEIGLVDQLDDQERSSFRLTAS